MSPAKVFVWAVLGLIALGALAVVGNLVGTAASVATAPGRVITRTLGTDNIIASYERFRDLNTTFQARAAQVRQYKDLVSSEADPAEKRRLRIDVAAVQQSCRDIAAKYNADSAKMNKAIFRHDAPETLDASLCE